MPSRFALIDWIVVAGYFSLVAAVAVASAGTSRRDGTSRGFFLASHRMPILPVALSVMATGLSAATFVGGPQQSYGGNLTYLAAQLGGIAGAVIVAVLFVPAFFRLGVTSVYELVGHRFGPHAHRAASVAFLLGRVMASGARLFIVALAVARVAFGSTSPGAQLAAVALVAVAATLYTVFGGIRAVIWTDVLQAALLAGAVALGLALVWTRIDLGAGEIVDRLQAAGKLTVLDATWSWDRAYTLPAVLIGLTLFNLAAYGTDQDLTQRLLTCRRARDGAIALVLSQIIAWPVVGLFLVVGLLLFVYTGGAATGDTLATRYVFLDFIVNEVPAGVRGAMVAGLFAAAMSSTDSALNAMASSTVADLYRPWRRHRGRAIHPRSERRVAQAAVIGWSVALAGFAAGCVFWQARSGDTLIDFALSVMVFAYGGLAGVFLVALLTPWGSDRSRAGALVAGALIVLVLMNVGGVTSRLSPRMAAFGADVAFPWRMTIAVGVSVVVAGWGEGRKRMA